MLLRYLTNPLLYLYFSALGAILCAYFYFRFRREIHDLHSLVRQNREQVGGALEGFGASLEQLRGDLAETRQTAGLLVPPAATRSGFNLNKRSQALQLNRRGESPEKIAAQLDLPRAEVELLMKVQHILVATQ